MTHENTTGFGPDWMKQQEQKRQWMTQNSLYREEDEHASCGVGLVVSINGKASRKVVENGIAALKAVWHRGAVDADGKTGDGAGIHVQIPVRFFYDQHLSFPSHLLVLAQMRFFFRYVFQSKQLLLKNYRYLSPS